MWIAAIIGLCGGIIGAYYAGKVSIPPLINGSGDPLLAAKGALAGCFVALLPALLLAFVAGGALGSIWGERLLSAIGIGPGGGAVGLAAGVAIVFDIILLSGVFGGIALARALGRIRSRSGE
jgi:hypothetical protein